MNKFLVINPKDTVAVSLNGIEKGEVLNINGKDITAACEIPAGHKIAICDMAVGDQIIKYGFPIGHAKGAIKAGEHVHSHNTASNLGKLLSYEYNPDFSDVVSEKTATFMGYRRPDGKVGIRNEVWIIPTVGCVNAIAKEMEIAAQQFKRGSIDGIVSYSHPYGCSQLGDDQLNTQKFLSGLIHHPNAAAVLVVGLGCENNNIPELKKVLGEVDEKRVRFIVCQDHEDEIAVATDILKELCDYAASFEREECPASELVLGLKCGGSDGFSGITANPLVGAVSDKLIAQGGSAILTEVPEMFGAETILMNRCRTTDLFDKTVDLINDFKSYFMRYGEKIDENPSPGNKAGGITTLEDKSLGCTQKGGASPVEDVLGYGEPVKVKGLSLLQGPGNDLVAACALAASGCHIVLFTTGRGTPFACPVPTVKIASNANLFNRKNTWMDFNAGELLEGTSMDELCGEFYDYILDVASGKQHAKSEALDKRDLAIFKDGVTL